MSGSTAATCEKKLVATVLTRCACASSVENRLASQRTVRPLGCFYWDAVWTLAAWCELRRDFRNFRVDRIEALVVRDDRFRDEAGCTLADLLRLECG